MIKIDTNYAKANFGKGVCLLQLGKYKEGWEYYKWRFDGLYLKEDSLHVELLSRGVAWLDTGTQKSLLEAGKFIETIESRQGLKVGCIEEIAYQLDLITKIEFKKIIKQMPDNDYQKYLMDLAL